MDEWILLQQGPGHEPDDVLPAGLCFHCHMLPSVLSSLPAPLVIVGYFTELFEVLGIVTGVQFGAKGEGTPFMGMLGVRC